MSTHWNVYFVTNLLLTLVARPRPLYDGLDFGCLKQDYWVQTAHFSHPERNSECLKQQNLTENSHFSHPELNSECLKQQKLTENSRFSHPELNSECLKQQKLTDNSHFSHPELNGECLKQRHLIGKSHNLDRYFHCNWCVHTSADWSTAGHRWAGPEFPGVSSLDQLLWNHPLTQERPRLTAVIRGDFRSSVPTDLKGKPQLSALPQENHRLPVVTHQNPRLLVLNCHLTNQPRLNPFLSLLKIKWPLSRGGSSLV